MGAVTKYYADAGAEWPLGGYNDDGITALSPAYFDDNALSRLPRVGASTEDLTVSPSIVPYLDQFVYGVNDQGYPADSTRWTYAKGSVGSYLRIYASVNGGAEQRIWSQGNPYYWDADLKDFVLDTGSADYLASPDPNFHAPWSGSSGGSTEGTSEYFHPNPNDHSVVIGAYNQWRFVYAGGFPPGTWTIRYYYRYWFKYTYDYDYYYNEFKTLSRAVTFTVGGYGPAVAPALTPVLRDQAWGTFNPFMASLPTPVPPVVANVSPAAGTEISPGSALEFDVTDDSGFRRILLKASFDGIPGWELVYDGDAFDPRYSTSSAVSSIAGGKHFSLMRDGGWPAAPTVTPFAIDDEGAENA